MHLPITFVQQFTLEYKNSILLEYSEIQDSIKNGGNSFKKTLLGTPIRGVVHPSNIRKMNYLGARELRESFQSAQRAL